MLGRSQNAQFPGTGTIGRGAVAGSGEGEEGIKPQPASREAMGSNTPRFMMWLYPAWCGLGPRSLV
ncbi:MAG: hypothetical protein ACJAZO_001957 [Myxococcota bacterium]|jgi:hypothetical protein